MTQLKIGDLAPDFTLPSDSGKSVHLHSFAGKFVVLYFYPKDDTPGCTIEAKNFNDLKGEFHLLDTIIIGISKDDTESHKKFKNKCSLGFDLVSDVDASVCKLYGVWGERSMFGKKYMGIARTTFLIDKENKIAHIWENVNFSKHAKEVMEALKSL